jgi:hypothetical protein
MRNLFLEGKLLVNSDSLYWLSPIAVRKACKPDKAIPVDYNKKAAPSIILGARQSQGGPLAVTYA